MIRWPKIKRNIWDGFTPYHEKDITIPDLKKIFMMKF